MPSACWKSDTMRYNPEKVIEIALAEVGYQEKETNASLDHHTQNAGDENFTKYARDLDAMNFYNGKKNGYAWCDVFVDWCFVKAFGERDAKNVTFQPAFFLFNRGAGCRYSYGYYQEAGSVFDRPEPGDQIFFYASDGQTICHTGLVYAADDTYVYTVEGNTSGESGVVDNGGAVCKKKYLLTDKRLAGFGRPDYQ